MIALMPTDHWVEFVEKLAEVFAPDTCGVESAELAVWEEPRRALLNHSRGPLRCARKPTVVGLYLIRA